MVLEHFQVGLLLSELLLELQELFLLTLADCIVFVGLLALLEGVTVCEVWLADSFSSRGFMTRGVIR